MQSMLVTRVRSAACVAAVLALTGCQTGAPYRDPDARLNPDMRAVVTAYEGMGAQHVSRLTVAAARAQPTLAAAVLAVQQAQPGGTGAPAPFVKTTSLTVPGARGPLDARLYDATPGHQGEPIILYFHGGGFVDGSIDADEASARALATLAHAQVLSVAYSLAPEAPFPAAQNDALAAYRWLLDNAATLGADRRRIAVAGESAGGILAIDTAIAARDAVIKLPVHVLVIDAAISHDTQTRSAIANQRAEPLNRADISWYSSASVSVPGDLDDPRLDVVGHGDLHGMPPTTVISAEIDPYESGSVALTQKLQAAGIDVARVEYQGTAHGFFGTGAVVARAKEAQALAASRLVAVFTQIGAPPAPRASRRHPAAHRHHGMRRPAN